MTRPDRQDAVVALAAIVFGIAEVVLSSHQRGALGVDILLTICFAAPLALRRRRPLPAYLVTAAALVVSQAALTPITDRVVPVVVVVFMSFSVARHSRTQPAAIGLACGLAAATVISLIDDPSVGNVLFPDIFFVWVPWLAGRTLRHRVGLADALADRTARLERDREAAIARGVREERRRIARELHDVVAHSVSVMVVQAGAGRRVAERNPDRAAECAELIERVGRDALGELRRLLGMMREEGEDGAVLAPQPSLAHLGDLVQRARDAGLSVEVRTSGAPATLPAGVDLAAYRIVQEALTNTLKHAGPAHARVAIEYGPEAIELEVSDDGRGPDGIDHGGHGLIGMRERAALCGGEVTCAPGPAGGFLVRAHLPLAEETEVPVGSAAA